MALDIATFETLRSSRYLNFTIPNPTDPSTSLLRVAVLDSPLIPAAGIPPRVAALLVPAGRESDWIFSTEPGHLQLLLSSPPVSRLILVGNNLPAGDGDPPTSYSLKPVNTQYVDSLVNALQPLFNGLSLKSSVKDRDFSDVPVLEYEDNVVSGWVLEKCEGEFVGEMLVEDVEIERREFRRRLRFKSMPNLVQTEVRIVPNEEGQGFKVDHEVLVHSYLVPMVAAVSLVGESIDSQIRGGCRPKALCLGVGGGALVDFLARRLDFEVVGVEGDQEVVRVAREYFGMGECRVRIHIGDAMEFLQSLAGGGRASKDLVTSEAEAEAKFDVVMVDLDCCDLQAGACAPPLEFVRKNVLLSAKAVLSHSGILIMNVIPLNRSFFDPLINDFRDVFDEVYEIDVGNEENFVLIAKTASAVSSNGECSSTFVDKLRTSISGRYLDSIRRI